MNSLFQPIRTRPEWQSALTRLDAYLHRLGIDDPFLRDELRLQASVRALNDAEEGRANDGPVAHAFQLVDRWFLDKNNADGESLPLRRLKLVVDPRMLPRAAAVLRNGSSVQDREERGASTLVAAPSLNVSSMKVGRPTRDPIIADLSNILHWLRRALSAPVLMMTLLGLGVALLNVHF